MAERYEYITEAFDSVRAQLTAMVGRMLNSRDEASDIIQEAFCRLWPRREVIGSKSEAAALATITAKNICIDRIRSNGRHSMVCIDEDRDAGEADAADRLLEVREQFDIVNGIINERLTELQRKIMQMKEFEEMTTDEIAQQLGMEEAAVRMNISRARKTIRELYQEVNI